MSLKVGVGDITKVRDVDVIVNAANGIGVMGAGVAGALAASGGDLLRDGARAYAQEHGPFKAGKCYKTDSGLLKRLGVKEIYHAVTMEFPGRPSSIEIVTKALRSTLAEAMISGVKSIAIPGLGTGIGGLDKTQVAQRMAAIIEPYRGQMDIIVIDRSNEFIEAFRAALKTESEEWQTT
jgi:O-acetyl-ADP-ribose deacetylase